MLFSFDLIMMSENVYKHHHVFQHFFKLLKTFLSKDLLAIWNKTELTDGT